MVCSHMYMYGTHSWKYVAYGNAKFLGKQGASLLNGSSLGFSALLRDTDGIRKLAHIHTSTAGDAA